MTQRVLPPILRDAATLVLVCRHRLEVPSRRQLDLRQDGWYAAVWCSFCDQRREVVVLVFRPPLRRCSG